MKLLYIITLLALVPYTHAAKRTYGDATVARVVNVYDGDTLTVDVDGWPPIVGRGVSVRVYGIDTPELRTKDPDEKTLGYAARDYVRELVKKTKVVKLKNTRRDKYFRILAEVYLDGQSLADLLIKKGYARPYHGGTKQKW